MKTLIVSAGILSIGLFNAAIHAQTPEWTDGQDADRVIGQSDFVTGDAGLDEESFWSPSDVAVDPTTGKIFVCDHSNSRVLRFSSYDASFDGAGAEAVFGADDFTTQNFTAGANRFNRPRGIFVDFAGRLWVCDSGNGRLLRFDDASEKASGADADGVLGQPDFTTSGFGLAANRMSVPYDVTGDEQGHIWVADNVNCRVLRFDNAAAKANGADADGVLGQPDFNTGDADSGTGRFNGLRGLAMTPGGALFTCDATLYRVYRYDDAASKSGVVSPDVVFGQDTLDGSAFRGTARNALRSPSGAAYSPLKDTLFVSDSQASRVVVIENVSAKSGQVDADALLGQEMEGLDGPGLAADRLSLPARLCVDEHGRVYVADSVNARVLRFSPSSHGGSGDVQPDLTIGTAPRARLGDGVYTSDAQGQTKTAKTRGTRPSTFSASLQNDGFARVNYLMQGSRSSRFSRVSYQAVSSPAGNITAPMILGNVETGLMAKGGAYDFRVRVSPSRASAAKRKTLQISIAGRDPAVSSRDAVAGRLKVR